jgi:hypothetical protein
MLMPPVWHMPSGQRAATAFSGNIVAMYSLYLLAFWGEDGVNLALGDVSSNLPPRAPERTSC